MTRARQQFSARGAMAALAAVIATAAVAAPAIVGAPAQALSEPESAVGVIVPDVAPGATPAAATAPAPEPRPEAEADPQPTAAEAEAKLRAQSDGGLRLVGNLPSPVTQTPERKLILTLSETISADTDIGLDDGGAGYGSISRLGVRYISTGRISSFTINSGIALNLLTGSGVSSTSSNLPLPDLSVGWQRSLSRTTQLSLSFSGSLKPESLAGDPSYSFLDNGDGSFSIVTEPGQKQNALRLSLSASATLRHTVNTRNQLTMSFSSSKIDYVDGASSGTPFVQTSLSGGWTGQLTPTVSSGVTASLSSYVSDAADQRTSYTMNLSGNGGWKVNPRLSLNGSFGPSLTMTSTTRALTGATDDYSTLSTRASAGINYTLSDTQWSASLSNGVQPTSLGATANVASLTAGMSHRINEQTAVSLRGGLSYRTALSQQDSGSVGDQMTLTAGATLSQALTQDVDASLGYSFRWRDDDTSSPMSHRVFLTLTRSFTLLP